MHILTYTNVYIHIRIYTWKYVCWMIRCELWGAASALQWLGLGAARPLTLTETASGPPGNHWLVTGHRRPGLNGPGRLGGGWACHWPCRRAAGGLPLSVTGRPLWRRTNEWKNWAYQADPRLCQCQVSSTGLVPEWLECGITTLLFQCC